MLFHNLAFLLAALEKIYVHVLVFFFLFIFNDGGKVFDRLSFSLYVFLCVGLSSFLFAAM